MPGFFSPAFPGRGTLPETFQPPRLFLEWISGFRHAGVMRVILPGLPEKVPQLNEI